jgi:hypothetical protein
LSNYGDHLESLRELARSTENEMLGLPDEAWPDKETREHCLGVFGYARVVLEASDGDLLRGFLLS